MAKKINKSEALAIAYSNKGHNHSAKGQDSLALVMYDSAIEIHKKNDNQKSLAKRIYNKGLIYFNQSDYKRANEHNTSAFEVFKKENDSLLMAKMLNSLGINHMYLSEYPDALSKYLEASLIYESLRPVDNLQYASVNGSIGLLYARLEKFDLALKYQEKALEFFKKADFQEGIANTLTNIGRIYNDLNNSEKAISFYQEAYEIMKKNGNERGMASALTNTGIAYTYLLNHKEAIKYFMQTKTIYEKLRNSNNLSIVHKYLGLCYLNLSSDNREELGKAKTNYEKALKYAEEAGSLNLQYDALENIAIINAKIGNYKKAYEVKNRAEIVKDSFNSVDKREEIARLETKHTYDKEKAVLKTEYEKEQAIFNAKVRRQKLIKNVIIASALALLFVIYIGIILYKRKRDVLEEKKIADFNTKVAETELKALRSQMNPHFIFNSLNSIRDYMVQHDIDTASQYLVKFSKLTRSILENSEKKWINLKDDLELLNLYIQIEALRLKNKLTYEVKIDEKIDTENTLVPPLILQPFIENSIWHGIAQKEAKGHILVEIKKENEMIVCIVDDNGVGRKKLLNSKPENTSMGVKITKNRLEILNRLKKVKGSFEMFDKTEGLRVELKLPLELRF